MSMTKSIILSTVAVALTGSAVMLAQAQQQAPQMNPDLANFFVAEEPEVFCQMLTVSKFRTRVPCDVEKHLCRCLRHTFRYRHCGAAC